MYNVVKRAFDIFASLLALIVLSPIFLITMLLILISDPGPVFYVARRIGKDDKPFAMFKFRSMRVGKANESVFRGEEDRIFPFGRFIRKVKIDELPQLLNILVGNMSIVGPRPAAPDQMDIVRAPKYKLASTVRAGLTCPSAVYDYIHGDRVLDETEYAEEVLPTRLALEPWYVKHRGIGLDLRMIWWTIVAVVCSLFGKSPNWMYHALVGWAKEEDITIKDKYELARERAEKKV